MTAQEIATTVAPDAAAMEAFGGKLVGDMGGALLALLGIIGDRHGLFRALGDGGPATSAELAGRAGIAERYAREWLAALHAGGYVRYDPAGGRFALPVEHALVLAQFGGAFQELAAMVRALDPVADAFRTGAGVPPGAYHDDLWDGLERVSHAFFYERTLVEEWLPALPDLRDKLERGATVADVGCGRGRALVALARAFPASRFVGYDAFAPTIARATANAAAAGVTDRVSFVHRDGADGLERGAYDLITTFDVVHDAARPLDLLRAIRAGLRDDGTYLCLEIDSAEGVERNVGPVAAFFYGVSVFYCLSHSLALGGPGLGTCGLPEPALRALCLEAGFRRVERAPFAIPFNVLYRVAP